jgi:hypothetical protein
MARDVSEQGFQKAPSRKGVVGTPRMRGVDSLPTPDEVGEVSNASDIGATKRPGSSAPSAKSSGPQTSNDGMSVPSVPASYRKDGQ